MAATNRDLEKEVAERRFRADLFHRLNVLCLRVPPLRERNEDIPALAAGIVLELAAALQLPAIPPLSADAIKKLRRYSWPGNIRELRNVLERALILSEDGALRIDLPESKKAEPSGWSWAVGCPPHIPLDDLTKDLKRSLIVEALRLTGGKKIAAASLLGITRAALKRQMQTLGFYGSD